jgi:hypothetical protein
MLGQAVGLGQLLRFQTSRCVCKIRLARLSRPLHICVSCVSAVCLSVSCLSAGLSVCQSVYLSVHHFKLWLYAY